MRLLNARDLTFKEFIGDDIPEYAIVSHRWGDDEPSYQSFSECRRQQKIDRQDGYGWTKIRKAAKLTSKGELEWFWIDTVCINKESSAELSESINSMYRWYEKSRLCFVFLPDVHNTASCTCDLLDREIYHAKPPNLSLEFYSYWSLAPIAHQFCTTSPVFSSEFKNSCWFQRSWTLQELLAPRYSVLFNSSFEVIGTNLSLASLIATTTGIPQGYLGSEDSRYSTRTFRACMAERMRWASSRQATRIEDEAYSLLGLLGVNMPLLYGEGSKAFRRLQIEIVKQSSDESIFAHQHSFWYAPLASDASLFQGLSTSRYTYLPRKHYEFTNMGIRFNLPICQADGTNLDARGFDHGTQQLKLLFPLNCKTRYETKSKELVKGPVALLLLVEVNEESLNLKYLKGFRLDDPCVFQSHPEGQVESGKDELLHVKGDTSDSTALTGRWIDIKTGKRVLYDLIAGAAGTQDAEEFSLYIME